MKAPDFAYCRAHSLTEVFDLLEQHGDEARLLAGGQTLLATLNMRLSAPKLLIDLAALRPQLAGIAQHGSTLSIGALTTHDEIERSALVARHLPLLAQAVPHVAHAAIRNAGTFGGSVALADPAAEYPACCLALKARLVIANRSGERRVAAADFFQGLYTTALAPDEVLVAGEFEVASPHTRASFQELARRHGDYAIIGLAGQAEIIDGRVEEMRLAFLSAGDTPRLAERAAAALIGQALDLQTIRLAQGLVAEELDPPADASTSSAAKRHLARVLTGRVLLAMSTPHA